MRIRTALAALFLLLASSPVWAQSPNFVISGSVLAGNPLHVTVYDSAGTIIPNASVTWAMSTGAALPSTLTVVPDPAGGFNFNSTTTATYVVKATVGAATGTFTLNFLGLKFTSP